MTWLKNFLKRCYLTEKLFQAMLKPVSHQLYDRLAAWFSAENQALREIADKMHTSSWFSLNVRQPCKACTIVLRSRTGLSQELQDCHKCGCVTVVPTSRAVIQFVAFLWQPCNKAQYHCTVIMWHLLAKFLSASCYITRTNTLRVLQQPCGSLTSA